MGGSLGVVYLARMVLPVMHIGVRFRMQLLSWVGNLLKL